jgi:serine/threonine-protein kinase
MLVDAAGVPKLLDFGIAKLVGEREAHTRTGAALFTPEYASPEQAHAQPTTAATDIYSLGAVLYELLTGSPPRTGSTLEILAKIDEDPRPPSQLAGKQVAGDLDAIVGKALRREPRERYESAAALADDLRRFIDASRCARARRASRIARASWCGVIARRSRSRARSSRVPR